jgi:hypothetical protein
MPAINTPIIIAAKTNAFPLADRFMLFLTLGENHWRQARTEVVWRRATLVNTQLDASVQLWQKIN